MQQKNKKIYIKLICMILVVTIMSMFTSCKVVNKKKTDKRVVRVGVLINSFAESYVTLFRTRLAKHFNEKMNDGDILYELNIQDARNDQIEQVNQLNNFIAQKYDAIIVVIVQSAMAGTMLDICKQADVPVIFAIQMPMEEELNYYINSEYAGKYTAVSSKSEQAGELQGKIVADLPNHGDINGDGVMQYIMIEGMPDSIDAINRKKYSISKYKELTNMPVECLDSQIGNWEREKSREIVANDLTKFGDKIEVIFSANDDMSLGALTSIEEAGRKVNEDIYIVSVDGVMEGLQAVSEGNLTATIFNDYIEEVEKVAYCIDKIFHGEKIEKEYLVDYKVINEDNIKYYQEIID